MVSEIKDFEQRKENLIKKGKELGFITYEELAEELKGLEIGSDLLDELYNALMENDISVVSESDLDDGSDEDDGGDLEYILKDNNIAKELTINDPVRMYLKEIGKISLLSLAEETELSERIAIIAGGVVYVLMIIAGGFYFRLDIDVVTLIIYM